MDRSEFVATSIAVRMTARLRATHNRRGISVFSGPPGLGKTTAIEAFGDEFPGSVAVMKISVQGARELTVLQHSIEAIQRLTSGGRGYWSKPNSYEARERLATEIDFWIHRQESGIAGKLTRESYLTLVFDEAQNLSRNAIESLRYWNDRDRCYSPFPLGLVFVGNNEFALKSDKSGASAISAAVADRALYLERYEYCNLSNADLDLFLRSCGIENQAAIDAVLKYYSTPRTPRSLRQVQTNALDILDEADGQPVTPSHVWAVLAPG